MGIVLGGQASGGAPGMGEKPLASSGADGFVPAASSGAVFTKYKRNSSKKGYMSCISLTSILPLWVLHLISESLGGVEISRIREKNA